MRLSSVKAGTLLVAEPYADDPFFGRSVVMVTQHDDTGTIGFILNKPLDCRLDELLDGFPYCESSVALGGPVGHTSLNFIHSLGNVLIPNAYHVSDRLFWGGSFEVLSELLRAGAIASGEVRFFLGYSGWTPGQLEAEIECGVWAVVSSVSLDPLLRNDALWYSVVSSVPELQDWALIPENFYDN